MSAAIVASPLACTSSDPGYDAPTQSRAGAVETTPIDTLQTPLFRGKPLDVPVFFELDAFDSKTTDLAYKPHSLLGRSQVKFGERSWKQVEPGRFVLAGSGGETEVVIAADASKVIVRAGKHSLPLFFSGTFEERRTKATFVALAAMSGAKPSESAYDGGASAGAITIGVIVILGVFIFLHQYADQKACQAYLQLCSMAAVRSCAPSGVLSFEVSCEGGASLGTSSSSATSGARCEWECAPGSGGDGGGGDPGGPVFPPPDESVGDIDDSLSNGDSNNGGDTSDSASEESVGDTDEDDCGGSVGGFSLGGIPGSGGTMHFLSADDSDGEGSDC